MSCYHSTPSMLEFIVKSDCVYLQRRYAKLCDIVFVKFGDTELEFFFWLYSKKDSKIQITFVRKYITISHAECTVFLHTKKKNQIFGIRTLGEDYVVRKAIRTDYLNISERNLILIHFLQSQKNGEMIYTANITVLIKSTLRSSRII